MRVILIRHYKTQFNVSGQIIGWGDSPQAENWLDDVVYVEEELRHHAVQPEAIYSSALGRARQTADYFADKLGLDEVCSAPQLNEVNYGSLCQRSKKWVAENYPEHKNCPDFVYPDGESFRQMQARSVGYVQSLAERLKGQTVLCVAHAGIIRGLVSHFLDLDYTAQLKRQVSHRYIGVLQFDGIECTAYDEWGVPSGFVCDGEIQLPYSPGHGQYRHGCGGPRRIGV